VFWAGHAVAVVACRVAGMMAACLPVVEQFFDAVIVASSDKDQEWF